MYYTFNYSGEVTVRKNSEEEAFKLVDKLVAPEPWAKECCENISVYDIVLSETCENSTVTPKKNVQVLHHSPTKESLEYKEQTLSTLKSWLSAYEEGTVEYDTCFCAIDIIEHSVYKHDVTE